MALLERKTTTAGLSGLQAGGRVGFMNDQFGLAIILKIRLLYRLELENVPLIPFIAENQPTCRMQGAESLIVKN